jgi:hypothetical protein
VAEDAAVSAKLYARLADYGDAPVYGDLIRSEKFDELLAEVEPLSKISPSAGRIQAILTTLKTTDNTDVKTVHRMLKDLRPLTSAKNGEVRYVAMRAMDILSDAVEKTADLGIEGTKAAGILMREARKAFRREKAVETLRHHFRDAGPVVSKDAQGRTVVNVKALMNSVDKLAASDPYFRGSFSAQEFQQLKDDIGRFAGTPAMPTKRPVRTAPEDVAKPKVVTIPEEPVPPTPEPRPTPPGRPRVPQRPPRPERPPVREEPYEPGRGPETYLRKPRLSRTLRTANTPAALVALGIGPWDYVSYALAKRLLTPQGRQKLARLMSSDGTMTAANMRKLMLGMQIPKATLQREARERRRDNERRAGERTRRRAQERQEFEALQRRRGF